LKLIETEIIETEETIIGGKSNAVRF
jgi:hypothetical protein